MYEPVPKMHAVDAASLIEFVREARPHLAPSATAADTEEWLSRLEERHDELHRLMENLIPADPRTALELAASLWRFWWLRDHMTEGRQFLVRVAAIDGSERAQALKGLGTIAFRQGDLADAEGAFHERLELLERGGTRHELAEALSDMARVALRRGDFAAVRMYAERGYAAAEGLEKDVIRPPIHMLAAAARMEGRLDDARTLYLRSREISEHRGNWMEVAVEDHNLLYVALHSGDRQEARRRFESSSRWIFANQNAYLRPYAILDAGIVALHDGDVERGGRLVACAHRIFEDSHAIPDPDDHVELDRAIARLKDVLRDRFDSVWEEGRGLHLDEAQTLARA